MDTITVAWQGYKCVLEIPAGPITGRTIRTMMGKRNGCPFVTEFSWLREGSGKVHSCKRVSYSDFKDNAKGIKYDAQGWDCKDG